MLESTKKFDQNRSLKHKLIHYQKRCAMEISIINRGSTFKGRRKCWPILYLCVRFCLTIVYKVPYRRAWPKPSASREQRYLAYKADPGLERMYFLRL